MRELSRWFGAIFVVCAVAACGAVAQQGTTVPKPSTPEQKQTASPANPQAEVLAEFNARLDRYIKLQRALAKDSIVKLKETKNPAEITAAQDVLAAKLRNIRTNAKQGDIFTPRVATLFKRLLNPEIRGPEGRETKQALSEEDGETAEVWLKVNATYPQTEVLATTPANILEVFPQLPMDVEYRITAKRHLILRDVDANIIVDFIPNAIR